MPILDWHEMTISPKTKNISMIYSAKRLTDGHQLRHEVISILKDIKIDYYGSGTGQAIQSKAIALSSYRFSIVIENSKYDYYFTEKIMDCFASGTIPIYWGCPSIAKFFDIRGIFSFDTKSELLSILDKIECAGYDQVYEQLKPYIEYNYSKVLEYSDLDDSIYAKINSFQQYK